MQEHDVTDAELKLLREDGLTVSMSVEEARKLIDEIPDWAEPLQHLLDEAQGTVFTESAKQAFVILVINP